MQFKVNKQKYEMVNYKIRKRNANVTCVTVDAVHMMTGIEVRGSINFNHGKINIENLAGSIMANTITRVVVDECLHNLKYGVKFNLNILIEYYRKKLELVARENGVKNPGISIHIDIPYKGIKWDIRKIRRARKTFREERMKGAPKQ